MILAELVQEVYNLTGRPDRVAETLSAVKAATLKAHQSDFYYKDLKEVVVAFDSADYIQALDYKAVLPLWRAVKYFRKYDYANDTPGKVLTLVEPANVFDKYTLQKQDIYYVAGAYVQINSSTQEQYYIIGYYSNPDITQAGYTSWVATDHPFCIIYDAAATIFKSIGKDDESANFRNLYAEQISQLRLSNIQANGY
jgi:hypothetical protein